MGVPLQNIKVYEFDSVSLPRFLHTETTPMLLADEKHLENRLSVILQSENERKSGLIEAWDGPRSDRLVLL